MTPLAHFNEKYQHLFCTFDQASYPQIRPIGLDGDDLVNLVSVDKYEVVVEGCTVGATGDFVKAVMIVMSAYYTFNLAYPKELQWFLTFIHSR